MQDVRKDEEGHLVPVRRFRCNYRATVEGINDPPKFGSIGAACFDIQSCEKEPVLVPHGGRRLIRTGLYIEIPPGYEIQIRSRSGLANKNGVFVLNSPGTIDSDYTGEICVILMNLGELDFTVNFGDRIAQGKWSMTIIERSDEYRWTKVDELKKTDRGAGGFGSTGVSTPIGHQGDGVSFKPAGV
jgi:dUTP pyrophosphatase